MLATPSTHMPTATLAATATAPRAVATGPLPARYYHLSVMSECDGDCQLCATLGCLRPTKITSPELQAELDHAQRSLKTAIVFPPNLLQHPEAAQFVSEVTARSLRAIVRLRPEQLVVMSELIATLQYRDAEFEVVVDKPLSEKVLRPRRGRAWPSFKTVLVPTRSFDPVLLYDSLPFSWRRSIEVLSCLPSLQTQALSPDEMFLTMKDLGHRVRPYVELDRHVGGLRPFDRLLDPTRFSYMAAGADPADIELSVIIAVDTNGLGFSTVLEYLTRQSLSRHRFEICFGLDGVNDDQVERLSEWCRNSGLNARAYDVGQTWNELISRKPQCWNLAVSYARGSRLLVLQSDLLSHADESRRKDWLEKTLADLQGRQIMHLQDQRSGVSSVALTLRHFFDLAGFAEAVPAESTGGCEMDFLLWKSQRIGQTPETVIFNQSENERRSNNDRQKASTSDKSKTRRKARATSAQRFYLCSLSEDVFQSHYEWLGTSKPMRQAFKTVAKGLTR